MENYKCNGATRARYKNSSPNKRTASRILSISLLCILLSLLMIFTFGCKKKETPLASPSPLPTATFAPTASPAPAVTVEVKQTAAYYFSSSEGKGVLYGCIEYTNTSKVPIVISQANFTFTGETRLMERNIEPLVYKNDIVAPGGTSTLAVWAEYEKTVPEVPVTVTAELIPEASDGAASILRISNPFIADNYPGFSTISGTLENPASDMDYVLSIVYFSFYDENNKLLGVWHFTKDMALPSEQSRNFVMHMRSLPIPKLGMLTKQMVTRGIGF